MQGFGRLREDAVNLAAVRFFAVFVIGISPSVQLQPPGCTAEAPQKRLCRRGGIPERQSAPEASTVALRSHRNASPFWIILLLRLPQSSAE